MDGKDTEGLFSDELLWYCIKTKPKQESLATRLLRSELGMEVFCPKIRFKRARSTGVAWVNEAMLIEELYDKAGRNFPHVARKMHRDEKDVRELYEKLQQLHQLVALSKGAKLHIDFIANESAFNELAQWIKNKTKPEQDSVRSTYFLGTLAGVNYRTLRHLRRTDAANLVYKEMIGDKALQPFLATVSATPSHGADPQDDPLNDLLGDTSNPVGTRHSADLMGVLGFLATRRPEESVDVGTGDKVSVNDLQRTIQDQSNLCIPISL
jgi:hypothetical protein